MLDLKAALQKAKEEARLAKEEAQLVREAAKAEKRGFLSAWGGGDWS